MAQDRKKALDEKTRKLSAGRIEDGKEHAAYQETQQQLLAIQAEQQQNLAVARAESKASFDNNQTLAQAAELGAISAAEAEQAAAMGAQTGVQLNPATQQILSKYGAGQPRFSRSQSHSQQVTKQNITINNNITSNTTNDVKVPANVGGPLQGRPLQFKDPSTNGGSVGKFKTWISAAFARQNEEGAKRDREYRHRESSLTKSASKMMKKLEDIGKTIGSRMDPRKIGSTWQSQLKTLLLLFGFGYLTSNWTKILSKVAAIEKWVKRTWGYFTGNGEGNDKRSFISDIKSFLGGEPNDTFSDIFANLLFRGKGSFLGLLKEYFSNEMQDRRDALKVIKFPWDKLDYNNIVGSLGAVVEYLGNILSVLISGSKAAEGIVKSQAINSADSNMLKKMESNMDSTTRKTLYNDTDAGSSALLGKGSYNGVTSHTFIGEGSDRKLTEKFGMESAYSQSGDIFNRINEAANGRADGNTAVEVSLGFKRMHDLIKETGHSQPINIDLLKKIISPDDYANFLEKYAKPVNYVAVRREKTEDDYIREHSDKKSAIMNAANEGLAAAATGELTGGWGQWVTNPVQKLKGWGLSLVRIGDSKNNTSVLSGMAGYDDVMERHEKSNGFRIEYKRENDASPAELANPNDLKAAGKPSQVILWEVDDNALHHLAELIAKQSSNRRENKYKNDTINLDDFEKTTNMFTEGLTHAYSKVMDYNTEAMKGKSYYKQQPYLNRNEKLMQQKYDLNVGTDSFTAQMNVARQLQKDREKRDQELEEAYEDGAVGRVVSNTKDVIDNVVYKSSGGKYGSAKLNATQTDRAKYAMARLMREGLTREQAAGIVGNLLKESSLNPKSGGTDSNSQYAGGIAGWNGDNYTAARSYFGKDLKNISFEDQLEYLIKEMKGEAGVITAVERHGFLKKHGFKKGAKVMDVMKTTTSLQDSTDTFERIFEGSGDFAGYWDKDKQGNRIRFHEGDRNKKRHSLASTAYKAGGGDLSNIKFEYNNLESHQSDESTQQLEEKKEPRSFLDIFKENIINYVTSFGGMTGPETNLTTKKESSDIGVDSSKILDKYTKDNLKESIDNIKVKEPTDLKVVRTETPNLLSMLNPENMKRAGNPQEAIKNDLADIKSDVKRLIKVGALGAQASANTVDAVKENTMASAQSSRNSAQAILAQQQNVVGKVPSLEETSNNSLKEIA